nr:HAMP domain-containing sensor histidine kinase [Maliibacterium massiliense]
MKRKNRDSAPGRAVRMHWKMFGYLAAFVAALLALLWLFQTVLLDDFYKAIKSRAIAGNARVIARSVDSADLDALLEKLAQQDDMCIRVVDASGNDIASAEVMPGCAIHTMPPDEVQRFCARALAAGGTAFVQRIDAPMGPPLSAQEAQGDVPPRLRGRMMQSMIYACAATRSDGSQALILINARITPVNSTVETLRVQLVWITVLLVLLAGLLAFFVSRKVTRPIVRINAAAKALGKGQYDISFAGGGYREIDELADTLTYAAGELSKVEALRRELIANISHDLRTPLTMIGGYAEVMRDLPGENTPENVQVIIDETRRLAVLVDDILDLSQMQSGAQPLHISMFNLTEEIRGILLRFGKLTGQEGYQLRFDYACDAFVEADAVKIGQVVYNLIGNAINHTGADKTVQVRQILSMDTVRIEVQDSGAGIAPESIPYIWERYYKAKRTAQSRQEGTGLGLAIVRQALELHHAHYGVDSTPKEGSTFYFVLPRRRDTIG